MSMRIETERLILRPFAETDAAAFSYISSRPIAAHFMSDMVMKTEEEALDFIRWLSNEKFDVKVPCVLLAIEHKPSGKCIGFIGVAPKPEINNEIEILFEIADEYQNNGYATEAGKAIIWWAFEKAGQNLLSAIVKPDNKASCRVMEKLGFVYCDTRILPYDGEDCAFEYFRLYHTDTLPGPEWDENDLYVPEAMAEVFDKRASGYNKPSGSWAILCAAKAADSPKIISVREHPEYFDRAVDYFSSKWGIDRKIYEDSISESIATSNPLPRWYLMLENDRIIGSYGLIENDFMVRKDLLPWLCALYVEESERGKALGSKLLAHGRAEAKKLGFDKLYLCTDHVGYYEKYGWRFFGMEESEFDGMARVYEIECGK